MIVSHLQGKTPILSGFNHAFASLHQDGPHEISEGFRKATIVDPFSITFMMTAMIPPTRLLVCPSSIGR